MDIAFVPQKRKNRPISINTRLRLSPGFNFSAFILSFSAFLASFSALRFAFSSAASAISALSFNRLSGSFYEEEYDKHTYYHNCCAEQENIGEGIIFVKFRRFGRNARSRAVKIAVTIVPGQKSPRALPIPPIRLMTALPSLRSSFGVKSGIRATTGALHSDITKTNENYEKHCEAE